VSRLLDARLSVLAAAMACAAIAAGAVSGAGALLAAGLALLPAALVQVALTFGGAAGALRAAPTVLVVPWVLCAVAAVFALRSPAAPGAASAATSVARALLALAVGLLALRLAVLARRGRTPVARGARRALSGLGLACACAVLGAAFGRGEAGVVAAALVLPLGLALGVPLARGERRPEPARPGPAAEPRLSLIQVARGMAHAMIKPVAAAREQLEFVAPRIDDAELRGEVESAAELLAQLQRLVRDLLDLARAQGALQLQRLPAGHVVSQAVDEVQRRLPRARIQVGAAEGTLRGDELGVRCLLVNLLENAVEAGGGEGPVELAAVVRDGRIELRVEDRAGGIDPSIRERLFEAFVTSKARGTGLGLAIVQEMCRAHGGRIEVHATPGGTRFVVDLPAAG
jgi:signal transduction histidine kinase